MTSGWRARGALLSPCEETAFNSGYKPEHWIENRSGTCYLGLGDMVQMRFCLGRCFCSSPTPQNPCIVIKHNYCWYRGGEINFSNLH